VCTCIAARERDGFLFIESCVGELKGGREDFAVLRDCGDFKKRGNKS
jgi:hypothetical protein